MCCPTEKQYSKKGRPNYSIGCHPLWREGSQGVQISQVVLVTVDVCSLPGQLFECYRAWVFYSCYAKLNYFTDSKISGITSNLRICLFGGGQLFRGIQISGRQTQVINKQILKRPYCSNVHNLQVKLSKRSNCFDNNNK